MWKTSLNQLKKDIMSRASCSIHGRGRLVEYYHGDYDMKIFYKEDINMARLIKITAGMEISAPFNKDKVSPWVKPSFTVEVEMEDGDDRVEVSNIAWATVEDELDKQIQKYIPDLFEENK